MIYLTTGANGSGKTLLTLRDVRAQQLRENRPVYYHGFEAAAPILEFGWLPFDPKNWQDLPDGSICVMDECQNEFPARGKADVPDYVNAIAQFRRKRGFDFWMITPHPMLLDIFVRRCIESPSWHRHLKRNFGTTLVSVLKWNAPNTQPEKPGSGDTGEVTTVAYPTEVYSWYKSASLHTGKVKIPFRVWVFVATLLIVPLCIWFAVSTFTGAQKAREDKLLSLAGKPPGSLPGQVGSSPAPEEKKPLTAAEYVASYQPRIPGLPHTAPRYDDAMHPVQAPKPAACVHGKQPGAVQSVCKCWTQQATLLDVPDALCRQIASGGFFDDTLQQVPSAKPAAVPVQNRPQAAIAVEPAQITAGPLLAPPEVRSTIERDSEVMAFMRKRQQLQ